MKTFTATLKHSSFFEFDIEEFDIEQEAEDLDAFIHELDLNYPIGKFEILCIHEGTDHSNPDLLPGWQEE